MHNRIKMFIALLFISIFTSKYALAADDKGQHGVRGAGLVSCAVYEKERNLKSQVYLILASWMDGYITGTNQWADDTYDVMPFQTTEFIANIISYHCKKNPTDRIFPVLRDLIKKISKSRLSNKSDKIEVGVGDRNTKLYVEVVIRLKTELKRAGYYHGEINNIYDGETIKAMKEFQGSLDFNQTGFPDQLTLWRLLKPSE